MIMLVYVKRLTSATGLEEIHSKKRLSTIAIRLTSLMENVKPLVSSKKFVYFTINHITWCRWVYRVTLGIICTLVSLSLSCLNSLICSLKKLYIPVLFSIVLHTSVICVCMYTLRKHYLSNLYNSEYFCRLYFISYTIWNFIAKITFQSRY